MKKKTSYWPICVDGGMRTVETLSKLFLLPVFFLAISCLFSTAIAADYYVSTSGSDLNSGLQSEPFNSIGKAAGVVTAGSTVHVAPGTYTESVFCTVSGTQNARIRFVSDIKWGAKMVGLFQPRGSFITIENFDISNPTGTQGIETYGSHTIITGNNVHDVTGGCPSLGGAGIHDYRSQYNIIENNFVHDIGNFSVTGCLLTQSIYLEGQYDTVRNNLIVHGTGNGISMWHGASAAVIVNNTVLDHYDSGILVGCGDEDCIGNDYTKVINNIVMNTGSQSNRYGIYEDGVTGINNIYSNNLVFGNVPADYRLQNGLQPGAGITGDPLFVNYKTNGAGDYHVQESSPAIDKANATYAPATDLDGIARPSGSGYDIGCYERQSTTGALKNIYFPAGTIKIAGRAITVFGSGCFNFRIYKPDGRLVESVLLKGAEMYSIERMLSNGMYIFDIAVSGKQGRTHVILCDNALSITDYRFEALNRTFFCFF